MRRAIGMMALVVLAAACSVSSAPATASSSRGASVASVGIPDGTPPSYDSDVEASAVPPDTLVPAGASVTDAWVAETASGSSILVAYVQPGADPLRTPRGLVVWRRFPGQSPPWRPVFGFVDPARRGVVEIHAVIGDATGDGSPDALTFEDTGGSGVCGTWRVLDLAANSEVFTRKTCDTTISFSTDPVGLEVREAVFAPGDSHCCPSSMRTSILVRDGSDWTVDSTVEQPS